MSDEHFEEQRVAKKKDADTRKEEWTNRDSVKILAFSRSWFVLWKQLNEEYIGYINRIQWCENCLMEHGFRTILEDRIKS